MKFAGDDWVKTSIDATRRWAMQVQEYPAEQREAIYELIEKNVREDFAAHGVGKGFTDQWVAVAIAHVRQVVADIENTGGGQGGNA